MQKKESPDFRLPKVGISAVTDMLDQHWCSSNFRIPNLSERLKN